MMKWSQTLLIMETIREIMDEVTSDTFLKTNACVINELIFGMV